MLTRIFLGMTPIYQPLVYFASSQQTSEGTETAAQDASLVLESITIEVNAKCRKSMSVRLTKSNVTSC